MFADSLYDSTSAYSSKRGWATLASFAFQMLGIGLLLLLPLIHLEGLPQLKLLSPVVPAFLAAARRSQPPEPARATRGQSNLASTTLILPGTIPSTVAEIREPAVPAPVGWNETGIGGGPRNGADAVWGSLGNGTGNVRPPPPAPTAHVPRISAMMEGYLIDRVQPVYPPLARTARIQGLVLLQAVISKQGRVENLRVIRGHPMLVKAAVDAVHQWRYRPYVLNGEAVEVETQITVNFVLSGS